MLLTSTSPLQATKPAARRDLAFTDGHFANLRGRIREAAGIALSDRKSSLVYARIARRIRALELTSFDAYLRHLDGPDGRSELQGLVNSLTTNTTHFFRETHHFQDLTAYVRRRGEEGAKAVRVWSAACSTGEEPYSIAMALNGLSVDVRVTATDIDTGVLDVAKAGVYPASAIDKSPVDIAPHMRRRGDTCEVVPTIKAKVRFETLNLVDIWPSMGPFDAAFCRNVVIYFDRETQTKVFERVAGVIRPGGRLYIGHAETIPPDVRGLRRVGQTTYEVAP